MDAETQADHPILHALVCRIVGLITQHEEQPGNNDGSDAASSTGTYSFDCGVTTEQRTDKSTVQTHTEHLALRLPAVVNVPVEIKASSKDQNKLNNRLEKGRNQIVGHLAKKLYHAFHFGGAGIEAAAVGVSLSQLSIEVIELKITGLGTNDVKLEGKTTGCVPLGIDPDMGKLFGLPTWSPGTPPNNEAPSGFALLAGTLLHADGQGLRYGQDTTISLSQVSPLQEELTFQYLGSGAFANVFQLGDKSSDEFMKVPLSANRGRSLATEAKILKKFHNIDGVPTLSLATENALSDLQATIRDEVCRMKGLRLKGVVVIALTHVRIKFLFRSHNHQTSFLRTRGCAQTWRLSPGCATRQHHCEV
ncbi:expressed unknown protein [Seminavis robusta]|uniref:Uncharacterized protein n=1 Tax=Seminavis robusta TaxID=568900 RepID=A0A9N8DRP6_9STRA|nr:expressed unknown protein [Seminavis robusta]|eukprot:Sro240_g096220.1 n/a (363) ;mRNA; f:85153-86241